METKFKTKSINEELVLVYLLSEDKECGTDTSCIDGMCNSDIYMC